MNKALTQVTFIFVLALSTFAQKECVIGTWSGAPGNPERPDLKTTLTFYGDKYDFKAAGSTVLNGVGAYSGYVVVSGTWNMSGETVNLSSAKLNRAKSDSKMIKGIDDNGGNHNFDLPAQSLLIQGNKLGQYTKSGKPCGSSSTINQTSGEPTRAERDQKFMEGLEAGTQKYQEGKKRKDDLQADFNSSKEIQDGHIKDRSSEAASKAQYDGSDDLEAMMNQEALNRLDASSGEFEEEPIEEMKKAELAGLLEEHEQWQAENGIGLFDPVRSVDDIFENDVFYEQGELRHFPCDKESWEDEFYRSNAHRPSSIKHDDIVEDENLMHSLGEYVDDVKGFILEYFKPEASGGYSFYDRMNDQQDAIEKVKETKEDIETIQDGFFERLFSFDAESVEEWLEERKKMTDEQMERFKFWNKLRGIEIKNRYEEEMPGLDHDEVVNGDCDDLDYNTTGYRHNNGEELKKIIGDDGGILDRFFYGL